TFATKRIALQRTFCPEASAAMMQKQASLLCPKRPERVTKFNSLNQFILLRSKKAAKKEAIHYG
ncbi:MAG TPA: hypothetical protein VLN72_09820, partial [Gillisia sp.]|nr:hypothetical protein [Gillisia sp.]